MACIICLQVRERCPYLVRECHVLLPLLEEMEKHITAFYQTLERASRITSAARDPDTQTQTQQKQKWQVRYDDNEQPELEWLPGQSLKSIITITWVYILSTLLPFPGHWNHINFLFTTSFHYNPFVWSEWNCWCTIRVFKYLNASLSTHFHIFFCNLPQDLLNQQQSCKRCLSVIERNYHTLQRALSTSKVFRNFDLFLLQKRVAEIQGSAQVSVENTCTRTHTRPPQKHCITHNADYINEITRTSKYPGGNSADYTYSCVLLFSCLL